MSNRSQLSENERDREIEMRRIRAMHQDRGGATACDAAVIRATGTMTFVRLLALALLTLFCFAMGTIPANERNGIADLFGPLLFVSAPLLYFLPTIEGAIRKQPNLLPIAIVNIFLGWTLIGWVVAMAWACKSIARVAINNTPIKPVAAPPPPRAASTADELTKLAALKEKGLLSDVEFAQQKAKLLA